MPWNRPHRLQGSLDLRFRKGDRPRLWGWELPDRWGVNFFYSLRSGRPYTPTDIRGQRTGKQYSKNAPFESVLDMKFDKFWEVQGDTRFAIVLELRNVFDADILRRVDSNTGKASQIGRGRYTFLTSDVDRSVVATRLSNPAFYGEGRNLRFGLEVSF
ncbi:MAG: hypothetical protein ACE5G2_04355 [Candidatus Krumholzibacteriia bacterium]